MEFMCYGIQYLFIHKQVLHLKLIFTEIIVFFKFYKRILILNNYDTLYPIGCRFKKLLNYEKTYSSLGLCFSIIYFREFLYTVRYFNVYCYNISLQYYQHFKLSSSKTAVLNLGRGIPLGRHENFIKGTKYDSIIFYYLYLIKTLFSEGGVTS